MKLKFISDFAQLENNRDQWDRVAGDFPFFQWNWLANWFHNLGDDLKLAVLVATDDQDNWIGIAPWCVDSSSTISRKLRFLGSGPVCSDYLDLIANETNYREFAAVATDWLVENIGNPRTLGSIDVVELEGITSSNPASNFLCERLSAHGMKSHTTELEGGWQVELPVTWNELHSRFSKTMRRKTKTAKKRVALPGCQILSTKETALETLWPIFTDLHQQRRKMLGQDGCFADPAFEQFLYTASKSLIEQSRGELIIVQFEGTPLATMLCFNDRETVYTYQSGMDVSRLNLEPGYQICYTVVNRSIANGFKKLDFLRGDEPYKARWNTTRIPIQRIRYIPRTSMATLKHGFWLAGRSLKHYAMPGNPTP